MQNIQSIHYCNSSTDGSRLPVYPILRRQRLAYYKFKFSSCHSCLTAEHAWEPQVVHPVKTLGKLKRRNIKVERQSSVKKGVKVA